MYLFGNAQGCCLIFQLMAQCAITNNRDPYIRLSLEQLSGRFEQIAVPLMASEMPYSAHNPCAHGKQWRYLLRVVETAQLILLWIVCTWWAGIPLAMSTWRTASDTAT